METREEVMAAATTNNSSSSGNTECSHPIVKGKRTKRQKLLHSSHASPAAAAAAAASSTSSSGELSGSTGGEDEDMANCLILLAQGRSLGGAGPKLEPATFQEDGGGERSASRRFAEDATATNGKASFYVYECKTCNKCFPSFQALGGHRSSHRKPKMSQVVTAAATEEKRTADGDTLQTSAIASDPKVNLPPAGITIATRPVTPPTVNGGIDNSSSIYHTGGVNKPRVHECSICGSEFSSGQALGGHMRRHRTAVSLQEPHQEAHVKKEKSILTLDLNLPAPDDDRGADYPKSPSFPFAGGAQPLIFSSSALVDCHY